MFTLVIASGAIMLGCIVAGYISETDMQIDDEILYHDQWTFEW